MSMLDSMMAGFESQSQEAQSFALGAGDAITTDISQLFQSNNALDILSQMKGNALPLPDGFPSANDLFGLGGGGNPVADLLGGFLGGGKDSGGGAGLGEIASLAKEVAPLALAII